MPTIYSRRHPHTPTNEYVVLKIGVPNAGGRVYELDVVRAGLKAYLASNQPFGTFQEHARSMTIDLNAVSHKVDRVWIRRNELVAKITPLNTPQGQVLQQLLAQDLVEFRTSGTYTHLEYGHLMRGWTLVQIFAVTKGQGT